MKRMTFRISVLAAAIVAAILFVCSPTDSMAQNLNKEAAMKKIADANAKYSDVISPFQQVKKMKGLKNEIVADGTLYFNRATSQLNMQYVKKNQLLITGDKLILINGASRQSFNTKSDAAMKTLKWTLVYCIGGEVSKAAQINNATVNYSESKDYYIFNLLIGKEVKGGWAELELSYSKKDKSLCLMKMVEKNGNYVLYKTPVKEFNAGLPDGIFNN